jgi:hypothetical protein
MHPNEIHTSQRFPWAPPVSGPENVHSHHMTTSTFFLPPLQQEARDYVDTNAVAFYVGVKPKTVRAWASSGSGPLLPDIKINGRNRYSVAKLRALLATSPD